MTLLAIVLPQGLVPSRVTGGRWVQQAAAQAGRILVVLDLACQARVRVLCLDEIFLHREPVLMAIEPDSMAWMAGQRGPDRSGESWAPVMTHWPCLEHVVADGGQGLERGVKLANAARCTPGQASEPVSSPAMTMGLDVFHTPTRARTCLTAAVETSRAAARHGESGRCQGGTVQAAGA